MLYFSYGSNMSRRRLQQRVGAAEIVGTGSLTHHSLRFHKRGKDGSGKCDAYFTGDARDIVHGVLFELCEQQRDKLNFYEGLGQGYRAAKVEIHMTTQGLSSAYTYLATDLDTGALPYDWYHEHVIFGACENQLPGSYIEALQRVLTKADTDRERHARERAIYKRDHPL